MAQRVRVDLVDDLDGTTAEESVNFALDGVSYIIDLSSANAAQLREDLAKWVGAARRTGGRRTRGHRPTGGPTANEIRRWARDNGLEVSDRGRVSNEVREAYDRAH
ncbi:histone-like nucleoid-structuring protein Lsr2 [Acidipropionibacterium timonense]|uniref:histone-like nucleoid-structuring protein Lsr2 n=1 Tax=Acidipropionibacterium timonense TaxID=2161818 RepID=UPI00102F9712|nr:Lsr2 family protein [Acidipropionibacterium timonense]